LISFTAYHMKSFSASLHKHSFELFYKQLWAGGECSQ